MESWQLLKLPMRGDVEARRMLSLRRSQPLGYGISVVHASVKQQRFLTGLGRGKVLRHGLGGTGRGDVLLIAVSKALRSEETESIYPRRRADDDGGWQSRVGISAIRTGSSARGTEAVGSAALMTDTGEGGRLAIVAELRIGIGLCGLIAAVVQCRSRRGRSEHR